MKRVSLLLTVLCAAGLPLTAAALDYGPDQRMLAAEGSAPALPSARGGDNPFAELTAPHRARADDEDTSTTASANADPESHPAAPAHTARRGNVPAPSPGPAGPAHNRGVLSWQSLLPGSIQ